MTEVKLTFSVPHALRPKLTTLRYIVDHLLILLGVKGWRWEFSDGAVKEVIRGPYDRVPPEVFKVPFAEAQELLTDCEACFNEDNEHVAALWIIEAGPTGSIDQNGIVGRNARCLVHLLRDVGIYIDRTQKRSSRG